MADPKEARRLEVLTIWAGRVTAAGQAAPTRDELTEIAANPANWSDRLKSPVLAAWSETVKHLLHQVKFGVSPAAAVDQLPEELARPSADLPTVTPPPSPRVTPTPTPTPTPAPTPAPTPTASSPSAAGPPEPEPELEPPKSDSRTSVFDALMQWRTERISAGAEGADLIKDVTLRNLVKFGYTDGEQIGKKLPGPAAYLGPEIAAVIAQFAGASRRQPEPRTPDPAPTTSSTARRPLITPPAPAPQREAPATPTPSRHSRIEDALAALTHSDFCDYEYGDSDVTPGPITIKSTADGVRLAFEPFIPSAGKMVIYRVVSGDDSEPYKPEAGDLVAVTTTLHVHDNRYLSCAVRNYQVWCHVGIDQEDARRNQPFLLAKGEEVSPVDDFVITEDEGRVIGQWTAYPGTRAVRVFRIPLEGSAPAGNDPRNQICVDQLNLTGFVDTEAKRGVRYLYRAHAEVNVGASVRLSRHKQQDILVSVELTAVEDLKVTIAEDGSQFDLTWTTPDAGQVRVYRVSTPPPPGLEGSDLPEAALQVQGFTQEGRIKHPVIPVDGVLSGIKGVPWPSTWERTYLTPVTVLGEKARIGTTQVQTRPLPPVVDAEIVERFHTEIVTFGWPTGAAAVLAYVGSTTLSPEEICDRNQPVAEMSANQYRRDGGLTFARPLAAKGCTVCLVPVSYSRGEQVRGQITALQYPGLHRMHYDLVPQDVPSRYVMELKIQNELDIESSVALIMRNRRDRFPLGPDDGELVYFIPPNRGEPLPQYLITQLPRGEFMTRWMVDWTHLRGFFRVFVSSQHDPTKRYALAETSLSRLWFDPAIGAPQ